MTYGIRSGCKKSKFKIFIFILLSKWFKNQTNGRRDCVLNGKINSEVYVKQPKGYEDGTNRVFK